MSVEDVKREYNNLSAAEQRQVTKSENSLKSWVQAGFGRPVFECYLGSC